MEGENVVKEIQIKNFRSLKDTGLQKLAPITLLVGENSSGKSSFLRTFPLLKQSISKKTSGPILWAGDVDDYVDFGSFEETVTNDGSKAIGFKFKFKTNNLGMIILDLHRFNELIDVSTILKESEIEYEITIIQSRLKEYVSKFRLSVDSEVIDFDLRKNSIATDSIYYKSVPQEELSQLLGRNSFPRYGYVRAFSHTFGFALPSIHESWEELYDFLSKTLQDEDLGKDLMQLVVVFGAQLTKQQIIKPVGNSDADPALIQKYNKVVEILQNNLHIADLIKLCEYSAQD